MTNRNRSYDDENVSTDWLISPTIQWHVLIKKYVYNGIRICG